MRATSSQVFEPPARDLPLAGLDSLDGSQRALLLDYWRSRADAEWTTMEALSHVRDDLLALGAPTVLLELADHAINDEERHSRWCHAMAERVGQANLPRPKLRGSRPLVFPDTTAAEARLLRPIFAGCLSETIAVCVLQLNRDEIAPGAVREAQRVHLADEVQHSRLGWAFLAHASESGWLDSASRNAIAKALPMMCTLAKELWSAGELTDDPELAALGFITRQQIDAGIKTAFGDVIGPAFLHHGFAAETGQRSD